MEVYLYNSTVCRLCGEENDSGTFLYSTDENSQSLSDIINTYLPIKVTDDGELPRTVCPGCTIQIEATVEFLTLIINGQRVLRELHQREKDYTKTLIQPPNEEVVTENIVYEVNTEGGVYHLDHPIALKVEGLEKPKRKRGRPPKKPKSPEELAQEAAARARELNKNNLDDSKSEPTGKRRRKTPTRFREAVQGKELERIFKEEGVTDGEESDRDLVPDIEIINKIQVPKEPEVIGHMENSGELVVVVKGKGRGRPKGPMRPIRKQCAICGLEFSCAGRYMSHVAQHGPVLYRCGACAGSFSTRLLFNNHQKETGHAGKNVISCTKKERIEIITNDEVIKIEEESIDPSTTEAQTVNIETPLPHSAVPAPAALPDLDVSTTEPESVPEVTPAEETVEITSTPHVENAIEDKETPTETTPPPAKVKSEGPEITDITPTGKVRLKCNQCEKTFATKQSKSMHIKAAHKGELPYVCGECGARFAYPRSLALHRVAHRRHARGYACDLCGKVLNHPSSVVYHKEAEHAGQRYVCGKCGKLFKHKQLLQRHQLVHTQLRPYTCKVCSATFKTKANLLNHQLLHSGVKKFSCEICKHRFAHKTSLTLHMRWHTGQKPYSCAICGKSFSQKGNLSEHERIHTGEKPFQCTLCSRRFTTSSQHRLHLRRHAAEKPYSCTHCTKKFVCRSAWAAHVRRACASRAALSCALCPRAFPSRAALVQHARAHSGEHRKQAHKQVSLLANVQTVPQTAHNSLVPTAQLSPVAPATEPLDSVDTSQDDDVEERVIYVTYDVDDPDSSAFHILAPEQAATIDPSKVLTTCELFPGPSLLVPQSEPEHIAAEEQLEQLEEEQVELQQLEHDDQEIVQNEAEEEEQIPVTDEQGNPLHFTMPDGTRLVITSSDGKSLQVITHDGQTIPVEINGYADEEEIDNPDTIVHHIDIEKSEESNVTPSHVTHYFTIV